MSKHTPGPWAWFGNVRAKSIYLSTKDRGRIYVMDFVRWGMDGAAPRFQVRDDGGYGRMCRIDEIAKTDHNRGIADMNHADARLIAAAPDLLRLVRYYIASHNNCDPRAHCECQMCVEARRVIAGIDGAEGDEG